MTHLSTLELHLNIHYLLSALIKFVSPSRNDAQSAHIHIPKMSKKKDLPQTHTGSLQELRIEKNVPRRHSHSPVTLEKGRLPKMSSRSSDFVYENPAYVGSLNSVAENPRPVPPTSVIREQYWTCSKWPYGQRILAIAVGVLVGAVIGLAVTVVLTGKNPDDVVNNIFQGNMAPD